jgi:Protein of unknown function (DUF1496)
MKVPFRKHLILLLLLPLHSIADDHKVSIVLNEIPSEKICIYKSEIYSEGAQLRTDNGQVFQCQSKAEASKNDAADKKLRWILLERK